MEISLKRMLGIADEGKRVYRFVSGEVTREEYDWCQTLDQLLFGEGGYLETLGTTWELINDSRFTTIENSFIVSRRAVFGGDAMTGKQYISSDGQFTSQIADLEEYSTILGEGRYFVYVITHPDPTCELRRWYFRIFPEMMQKEGLEIPEAVNLKCTCNPDLPSGDPHTYKDASDETLWGLIRQECPNYFNQEHKPNKEASRLLDLFRADLLGLIADYAVTPLSDAFVELDTGDVIGQQSYLEQTGVIPQVFLEVDILEKALTYRAVLRATAAKILRQMDFHNIIKDELGGDVRLTDTERDSLLQLVYNPPAIGGIKPDPSSNWYGYLHVVKKEVTKFIQKVFAEGTFEERQSKQFILASAKAKTLLEGLQSGEIKPINQFTEPDGDVSQDSFANIMQEILHNPLKQELFIVWTEAERRGGEGDPAMSKLYSVLTPIFTDASFVVGEEEYNKYMEEAVNLGYFGTRNTVEVEEEYHGEAK